MVISNILSQISLVSLLAFVGSGCQIALDGHHPGSQISYRIMEDR